jgi:hypothetical protein
MTKMIDARMQTGLAPELFQRLVAGNPPRIGEGNIVYSGAVRMSWPSLSKPTVMKGQEGKATPKHRASGLWPHKNIDVITGAVRAAIRLHYPNVTDPAVMMNPRDKNHPLKDQGLKVSVNDGGFDAINKSTGGYVPGLPFCTATSTKQVPCLRRVGGKVIITLPEEIDREFYAGCWVDLKLAILKSTSTGNPGVYFGLQGMMKLADDTAFGGGGNAATAEDFAGAVAIEDPNVNQIMQSSQGAASNDWG